MRKLIISTLIGSALSLMTPGMPGRRELALASQVFHKAIVGDDAERPPPAAYAMTPSGKIWAIIGASSRVPSLGKPSSA